MMPGGNFKLCQYFGMFKGKRQGFDVKFPFQSFDDFFFRLVFFGFDLPEVTTPKNNFFGKRLKPSILVGFLFWIRGELDNNYPNLFPLYNPLL